MVRNDFAVRVLEADASAGIEAPIRFYLTESTDGLLVPSDAVCGLRTLRECRSGRSGKGAGGIWEAIAAQATT